MTSPYLGISYLKQISFPEKYLRAILSYIYPKKIWKNIYIMQIFVNQKGICQNAT